MDTQRMDDDLLEQAWGVIANAYGGNWGQADPEWHLAASRWRENWNARLRHQAQNTVRRFRKLPVEVDAMPFDGSHESASALIRWIGKEDDGREAAYLNGKLFIYTLEGVHEATPGDFIIRGVQGEHYPCKPDIFAQTYEEA